MKIYTYPLQAEGDLNSRIGVCKLIETYKLVSLLLLTAGLMFGFANTHAQSPSGAVATNVYQRMLQDMLSRNPAILLIQGQIKAAQYDTQGNRWQYYPTPSVGIEQSNGDSKVVNNRTKFARLQQPLWTGGRLSAQLERSLALEEVAEWGLQEQQLTLAMRWLELWAEVQAAELRVQAFSESETQHQLYMRQVLHRAQQGQAPASDVELSQSRLLAVQSDLAQARSQTRQAVSKLQQMWGPQDWPSSQIDWLSSLPSAAQEIDPWIAFDGVDWLSMALAQHPSLRKIEASALVAKADVDLARAHLSPEIYLRGEITKGDVNPTVTTRQLFVGLSSSLGAGLSVGSAIAAAQTRLDANSQEAEVARRNISDQIQADTQLLQMQAQRFKLLQQAAQSNQQFLLSSERQFEAGRRSWQELMNTAREKAQTLVQVAEARTQFWLAGQRLWLQSRGLDVYLDSSYIGPATLQTPTSVLKP
jgi:outer membrane protein, adhesin transport system